MKSTPKLSFGYVASKMQSGWGVQVSTLGALAEGSPRPNACTISEY
ncbi:hypothetical protein ABIE91_005417 [Bradyrhizobium elkanii]